MLTPNLKTAIVEFIKNEYRLEPSAVREDLHFQTDLGLDSSALSDLLGRMQDSLDFVLAEDSISQIETLEDLYNALDSDLPEPENSKNA